MVLGAYSIGDKVISSVRMLIVAFTYAIYPNVAIQFKADRTNWIDYKKKMNKWLGLFFILFAVMLFFGAEIIVQLLTGTQNLLSSTYIKTVSLVPLFMALNTLNIVEFLIKNQYKLLFYCSVGLLLISLLAGSLFIQYVQPTEFGFYALFIEISAFVIARFYIKKEIADII
jgi:O-antigen/teichoic acid export membrane protein